MLASSPVSRTFLVLPRPASLSQVVFGLAAGVVWIHLLDATFVHPQANANLLEQFLQATLALIVPPAGYIVFARMGRAARGGMSLATGIVATSVGLPIHLAGVIRQDEWRGSDFTGVAMGGAGIVLMVVGVTLLTAALPKLRYRLLMAPATILVLMLVVAPLALSVFVTHVPRTVVEPMDLGAAYETVSFETSDGLTLHGWYVPSRNGAAVALIHGSGGSRMGPAEHARMLIRHGYGVLLFDTRGHGESDGGTMALGWGAAGDAEAAAKFLETREDVQRGRIGVLGLSMGAELALESGAAHDRFAAIVSDGPSGRTFADGMDSSFPVVEALISAAPAISAEGMEAVLSRTMPPPALTSLSPKVTEPVLYIASSGAERALVTKIANRSGGEHELWVVDAAHTQGLEKHPEEYERRVTSFFDRILLAE